MMPHHTTGKHHAMSRGRAGPASVSLLSHSSLQPIYSRNIENVVVVVVHHQTRRRPPQHSRTHLAGWQPLFNHILITLQGTEWSSKVPSAMEMAHGCLAVVQPTMMRRQLKKPATWQASRTRRCGRGSPAKCWALWRLSSSSPCSSPLHFITLLP